MFAKSTLISGRKFTTKNGATNIALNGPITALALAQIDQSPRAKTLRPDNPKLVQPVTNTKSH